MTLYSGLARGGSTFPPPRPTVQHQDVEKFFKAETSFSRPKNVIIQKFLDALAPYVLTADFVRVDCLRATETADH
jgi:hypothetical protein